MKMSVLLASCLFTVSLPAFALEMQSIETVKSVELQGSQLSATYQISGGCAQHEALFRVTLEKEADNKTYIARVALFDKTETSDHCEAILVLDAQADLNVLIKEEAARKNIKAEDLGQVRIQLPALSLANSL